MAAYLEVQLIPQFGVDEIGIDVTIALSSSVPGRASGGADAKAALSHLPIPEERSRRRGSTFCTDIHRRQQGIVMRLGRRPAASKNSFPGFAIIHMGMESKRCREKGCRRELIPRMHRFIGNSQTLQT